MTMRPCVYVTSGWGIHDDRWTAALRSVGFEPSIVRWGTEAVNGEDLRGLVSELSAGGVPVLAGPLDAVTFHLTDLPTRVVGLSWGFDIHQMADRGWLSELDVLIIDSRATAELAIEAGVQPDAITFLPWGVDLEVFTPNGPAADLSRSAIPTSARTLLSLRAHEPLYRTADIIDAFAQMAADFDDVHLIIGHTGSLTGQLQQQATDLGIMDRTHFIGTIGESDLAELLRAVDIYVSASEVDGTSVTLLQAMACRTTVVVSDSPGNRAWITPGYTGHFFATRDVSDLSRKLRQALAQTQGETDALTAQARALVEQAANWQENLPRLARALTGPQ